VRYRFTNVKTDSGLQITHTGDGTALLGPVSITCEWMDEFDRQMQVEINATSTANGPEAKSVTIAVTDPDDRLLTDDLRIPIDRILQAGMQGGLVKVETTSTGRKSTPLAVGTEQHIPTKRTRRRKTDTANSKTIAADYRKALFEGLDPAVYIMEKHSFSRSKTGRLIRQARDDKELGEAIKGRAGEGPIQQQEKA